MTPPAATAAGRRPARSAYAPRAPRRVSGPAFAPAFVPAFAPAPARTRREAAPARAPHRTRVPREAPRRRTRARELPRLDRVVRGRAWIPLLGALLVVIVGLRVEVLKLGSSVGRELQQATTLESGNAALRAQVSALSGNQRIEQLASTMGMTMPGPMDTHFVNASSGTSVNAAIRGIHAPSAQMFLSGIVSERQTDARNTLVAANTSAVGALGGGTPTSATSTSGTPTSGSTTAGTATLGTSSAGTATSGTPTSVTPTSNVAATNAATAGTTPSTTGAGSTSTATGSVGAVSNTSGTNTPTGPNTGGASLGG